MKGAKELPTTKAYLLVLLLRYLAKWERSLKRATQRVHYIGGEHVEWLYPEKKKYIVQILKYRIFIWLSVHKDTPPVG